jgi:hypothetical protein
MSNGCIVGMHDGTRIAAPKHDLQTNHT